MWLVSNSAFGNICFRWYFAVISMSGVFAVTFSVIFAYVADITQEHERSTAYGLVRSLVTGSSIEGNTWGLAVRTGVKLGWEPYRHQAWGQYLWQDDMSFANVEHWESKLISVFSELQLYCCSAFKSAWSVSFFAQLKSSDHDAGVHTGSLWLCPSYGVTGSTITNMNCQDSFNCLLLELSLDGTKQTCHILVYKNPCPRGLSPCNIIPFSYCGRENKLWSGEAVLFISYASRCQPRLLLVWSQAQQLVHTFPKPMVIHW